MTCPDCPTSQLVRALVYGAVFWRTAAAVVAPFPILALVVLALHRIGRAGGGNR